MNVNVIPALNTVLIFIVMGMVFFRSRIVDLSTLRDEIEALKLRLSVQEKVSPCPHCRQSHGAIVAPGDKCDC